MKTPLSFTLGSDPELFLIDNREGGRIVSAIPVLKCLKDNPLSLKGGVKAYADNVLLEASFPPSTSVDGIVDRLRGAFVAIQEHLGGSHSLLPQASHVFAADQLKDVLRDKSGIKMDGWSIGCTPSINVWKRCVNKITPFPDTMRTGSFHIHLGSPKLMTMEGTELAIRVMDVFVGCASILFCKDPTAVARRKVYGQAGEARRCDAYGCEYRVLDNYALRSPDLVRLVGDLTEHAMTHINGDTGLDLISSLDHDDIQRAINTSDKGLARSILMKAGLPMKLLTRVDHEYDIPAFNAAWGI